MSPYSPIILPIANPQPSFTAVIDDVQQGLVPSEDFWISCYKSGEPSIHGKVGVSLDESNRAILPKLEGRDGVDIQRLGGSSYTVSCSKLGIPATRISLPRQTFTDLERSNPRQPHQITAFDVAPDGTQYVTGYNDGSVLLRPITFVQSLPNPDRLSASCHLSSVSSVRFFPSSRVLLSAGADFTLHILPAEGLRFDQNVSAAPRPPFKPVRTLKAHTRAITDTAMVARGRNVLSCAKDSTVRLWDMTGGQQIRAMWSDKYVPILKMSVGERAETKAGVEIPAATNPDGEPMERPDGINDAAPSDVPMDSREVDTADKLVFCALQDGHFEVFDLGTKRSVHHSRTASEGTTTARKSLVSVAYSPADNLLATGSSNGIITVYDTRYLAAPVTSFARNQSSVEDLAFIHFRNNSNIHGPAHGNEPASEVEGEVGLAIATEDGLPYVASVRPEGPGVVAELVGPDCEAVRTVRARGAAEVWLAGDDGVVRKY